MNPSIDLMKKACQVAISRLQKLLSSGEKTDTFEAIKILKNIQNDNIDIKNIIYHLLPFTNVIFCSFVRIVSKDFINTLDVYEILFNTLIPDDIIKIIDSKVIEPEYAKTINNIDSLENILYLIIQNCKYNDSVKNYLLKKYNNIITDEGVFKHMIMYNIPNDIVLYLKTCIKTDKFNEKYVNFKSILYYYKQAEKQYSKKIFASRLNNVIQLIINIKMEKGYEFPTQEEFVNNFKKYYKISDPKQLHFFMEILPYDAHLYFTTEYMIQYTKKIFPPELDNVWY